MSHNNKQKVIVVTGSSRGIGKAIAVEFAKAGYSVVINARDEEELKRAAEDISKLVNDGDNNNKVAYVAGDISQEQTCIALL
jgi:3-oxoacyl-[acyl-carrier protein] reductase